MQQIYSRELFSSMMTIIICCWLNRFIFLESGKMQLFPYLLLAFCIIIIFFQSFFGNHVLAHVQTAKLPTHTVGISRSYKIVQWKINGSHGTESNCNTKNDAQTDNFDYSRNIIFTNGMCNSRV